MKIQILVSHYREEESVIKRFLSSLQTQKDAEFEVLLFSDGGGVILDENLFGPYSFPITYKYVEHGGVCAIRNKLMDASTAEYIMFCDCDDEFTKEDGLYSLINAAESTHADIVGSPYLVEKLSPYGELTNVIFKQDTVRVHGKIFRRDYIYKNNLRFIDELELSGDMAFLWLAFNLTSKIEWVDNVFYTWKYNANSVTHSDPFISVKYFDQTIRCYTILAEDLLRRNKPALFTNTVTNTIAFMYVTSTLRYWRSAPIEYQKTANKAIADYLKAYYPFFQRVDRDYQKEQYDLVLEYKNVRGKAGSFSDIGEWAQKYLNDRYFTDVLIVGYGPSRVSLEDSLKDLYPDVYDVCLAIDTRKNGYKYKAVFICTDRSEIAGVINEINADIYVIKTPVMPGTTEIVARRTGKRVVFIPEYCNNDFTIVGGGIEDCCDVIQVLQGACSKNHLFRITDQRTAELVGYMNSCYAVTKASFCNQFYNLANQLDVSYEELRELFIMNPDVEPGHTFVYAEHPYWNDAHLNWDIHELSQHFNIPFLESVIRFNEDQIHNYEQKNDE